MFGLVRYFEPISKHRDKRKMNNCNHTPLSTAHRTVFRIRIQASDNQKLKKFTVEKKLDNFL
jgi:hypothetical protein